MAIVSSAETVCVPTLHGVVLFLITSHFSLAFSIFYWCMCVVVCVRLQAGSRVCVQVLFLVLFSLGFFVVVVKG